MTGHYRTAKKKPSYSAKSTACGAKSPTSAIGSSHWSTSPTRGRASERPARSSTRHGREAA